MKNKSYYFEIDGESFVFCNNFSLSQYTSPYKLMIWELNIGWITIAYPDNLKQAKQLAKKYLEIN